MGNTKGPVLFKAPPYEKSSLGPSSIKILEILYYYVTVGLVAEKYKKRSERQGVGGTR
jgi:hypothetical protein